ncbi:LamG domain-containing protein [Poriferisphaera sp. WC338]|uniref:LamG domain-containing protein n=1 Tax=Poriferisphaera sp. WC338 TaxID=3425129 RepID=UPI003D81C3ED
MQKRSNGKMSFLLTAACGCVFATQTQAALISSYSFDDSSQTKTIASQVATTIVDDQGAASGDLRYNGAFYDVNNPVAGGPAFVASGAGTPLDALSGNHGSALSMPSANGGEVALGKIGAHDFEKNDFSMAGWFKLNARTGGTTFIYDNAVHNFGGQSIAVFGNGLLEFAVKGTSSDGGTTFDNISIVSDSSVDDGQWHFFAAIIDDEVATLSIDGVQQGSSVAYGLGTKARPTGSKGTRMAVGIDGELDTFKIYDHALTAGELNGLYKVPEPASLMLLSAGTLLLSRRSKK